MSIFVGKDDVIRVPVVIGIKDSVVYVGESVEALTSQLPELDKSTVESHEVVFRYPTFKDNTVIFDASVIGEAGHVELRMSAMRYNRLRVLLKSWTFTDGGKPVETNEDSIASLHPNVGSYLASEIEKIIALM